MAFRLYLQLRAAGYGTAMQYPQGESSLAVCYQTVFKCPAASLWKSPTSNNWGKSVNTSTQPTKVTPMEFSKRHPGVDLDLLLGFINRCEADLYQNGSIVWTDNEPPIVMVDEKRFFDHLLRQPF